MVASGADEPASHVGPAVDGTPGSQGNEVILRNDAASAVLGSSPKRAASAGSQKSPLPAADSRLVRG